MTTTAEKLDSLRADRLTLSGEKDDYLAKYRPKARKLSDKIDVLAAELVAERTVAEMSDPERQAIGVELTRLGGDG